jgi:hypothetical protein
VGSVACRGDAVAICDNGSGHSSIWCPWHAVAAVKQQCVQSGDIRKGTVERRLRQDDVVKASVAEWMMVS